MVVLTHTFMFADLCGYTEYTWRHGDDLSAELAITFYELVCRLAAEESCDVVKSVGDGVMLRANECSQALRLAQRIHDEAAAQELPAVRIGIDTGPAVPRNGDWYGTTVNTAARVTEAAAPGEALMTDRARTAAVGAAGVELIDRGWRTLKGLPDCLLHAAGITVQA
jgi:adenylate cyclase